jgi:3-hydroxybutyryl-CoA dehydratase
MNSNSTIPMLGQMITYKRTFTQQDFDKFAELSHDDNPIHVNAEFAATTRFGRTVSHGMLLYGVLCGVLNTHFPNARQLEQELIFPKPTYADEEVTFNLEVTEIWPVSQLARLKTTVIRADGEMTCEGLMLIRWQE